MIASLGMSEAEPSSLRETWTEDEDSPALDGPRAQPGSRLGRYQLLEPIGVGAMGEVFRAYDPQLDRDVAIKRLALDRRKIAAARLLREAKTIARLSHPNVVQVHDAGRDERTGDLFIAMELIEGQTLRRWLEQEPRSWTEIVAIFVQAGQGLAAAHERGIVHRDFKPENVLVTAEGQAKVVDFGLAKPSGDSPEVAGPVEPALDEHVDPEDVASAPSNCSTSHPSGSRSRRSRSDADAWFQTPPGSGLGTPAYMPPEQLAGNDCDPRADQFSFAVALYEALVGRLPFSGRTLTDYAVSVLEGDPVPFPRSSRVPRAIQDAVFRALQVAPRRRFEAMDPLLEILARDPAAKLKRTATWFSVVMLAGLSGLTVWGIGARSEAADPCERVGSTIDDRWTPQRKATVLEQMRGVEVPYAADTAQRVVNGLDDSARAWAEASVHLCRLEQSSVGFDASPRRTCLHRALHRHERLVEVLQQSDPSTLRRALDVVDGLQVAIDRCNEPAYLAEQADQSTEATDAVTAAIAQAELHLGLGQIRAGLEVLAAQVDATPRASWTSAQVLAESGLRSQLLRADARLEDALHALHEGAWEALGSPAPLAAAKWHEQHGAILYELDRIDEMPAAFERSHALYLRHLGADHMSTVLAQAALGHVPYARGDYPEALRIYQAASAAASELAPPDDPDRLEVDGWRAETLVRQGEVSSAIELGEDLVQRWIQARGERHPQTLSAIETLASMRLRAGDGEAAVTEYRRVLELMGAPKDHEGRLDRATTLANLGAALFEAGRTDEAQSSMAAARQSLVDAGLPPTHHKILAIDANRAAIFNQAQRHEEAAQLLSNVVAEMDRSGLLATTNGIMMRFNLVQAQLALGRLGEATELLGATIADARRGGDKIMTGRLLGLQFTLHTRRGRKDLADEALREAEEALADLPPDSPWRVELQNKRDAASPRAVKSGSVVP